MEPLKKTKTFFFGWWDSNVYIFILILENDKIFEQVNYPSSKILILPMFETCSLCALLDSTRHSDHLWKQTQAVCDCVESSYKRFME
jgi:hypothetical protein